MFFFGWRCSSSVQDDAPCKDQSQPVANRADVANRARHRYQGPARGPELSSRAPLAPRLRLVLGMRNRQHDAEPRAGKETDDNPQARAPELEVSPRLLLELVKRDGLAFDGAHDDRVTWWPCPPRRWSSPSASATPSDGKGPGKGS